VTWFVGVVHVVKVKKFAAPGHSMMHRTGRARRWPPELCSLLLHMYFVLCYVQC
jgi:hypothetical protein